MTTADTKFMKRALTLARKGIGKTSPNPAVGCVIVKDGVIVGEGWHKKAGGPHAEVHALSMAGSMAVGSDVYVTLEPCCHTGKTPPCSEALIKAGVRRVIAGMPDPNPKVSGGGLKALADAGIITDCGLFEMECRAMNPAFIKHVTSGMPYVTYKCAMTLDGMIATASGHSRWISCAGSRKIAHKLRAASDAIMVGVGTVIADNPLLTVRDVPGKNPIRIIVDSRLRTPVDSAVMVCDMAHETIIATTEADPVIRQRYQQKDVSLLICSQRQGKVDLTDMMAQLGKRGIQSILLEGGSSLAGELLKQGLIDECVFFYAPMVTGSDGYSPFGLTGITEMASAFSFKILKTVRSGCDIVVYARPEKPCLQD